MAEAARFGTYDRLLQQEKEKKVKLFSEAFDKAHAPLEALTVPLVLAGMVRIVENRAMTEAYNDAQDTMIVIDSDDDEEGKTAYLAFQKKHWFDDDVTIEYFDFLLDVLYPGKKVGVTMDMAPQHRAGAVAEYIKRRTEEGRLHVVFIDAGLTSILQVCDLAANKQIKAIIKELYYEWRAEYVKSERERLGDRHARVVLKMDLEVMTKIVEKAVKRFNDLQKESKSIAKTFKKAGQDPYSADCEAEFKAHLESLAKLPSYQTPADIEETMANLRRGVELTDANDVEVALEEEEDEEFRHKGDRVAKMVNGTVYFGTVIEFGYIKKNRRKVDAWCIKFDEEIVTYENGATGHEEDFVLAELKEAIKLYKENRGLDAAREM